MRRSQLIEVARDGSSRFTRITDGLVEAKDGDTVFVRPGVYRENVTLSEGVSLIGAGPENTVLESDQGPIVRALDLKFALLLGFKVQRVLTQATQATAEEPSSDYEGEEEKEKECGVLVASSDVTIMNCRVTGMARGDAIRIVGDASPVVVSTVCDNNVFGIGCYDTCRPLLRHNTCRKNKLSGIVASDYCRVTVQLCLCEANDYGIWSDGEAQMSLMGNCCRANMREGIVCGHRAGGRVVASFNLCEANLWN